jgi:glycosyltransferase involved in cell wall biosynthesis
LAASETRRKTKVLFCTVVPLDQSSGGTKVCREHVLRLAQLPSCELRVLAPNSDDADAWVTSLGGSFEPLPLRTIETWRARILRPFAFMLERAAISNLDADIRMQFTIDAFRPDWIVLDYLYTALYVPSAFFAGIPVAVVNLNREGDFYRQQRAHGRLPPGVAASPFTEWRLDLFERETCHAAAAWIVLSENDVPDDPALASRCRVIKPAVDSPTRQWRQGGGGNLFFVGSIQHYPNYDAVRWLCTVLAPALLEAGSDTEISIIGAAAEDVPHDWRAPNVVLLGRSTAEEVQRQFCSCGLFIAPIENDFGSKIKVLEALAYGTPLVATRAALSGLVVRDGIPTISMSDPAGAAETIVELLASPAQLQTVSSAVQSCREALTSKSAADWSALIGSSPPAKPAPSRWFLKPRRLSPNVELFSYSLSHEGFHAPEGTFRWTSRQASITIPVTRGSVPRWLYVKFLAMAPPAGMPFRIQANGETIHSGVVARRHQGAVVKLPDCKASGRLTLSFECAGFKPINDDRVLGLAVQFLKVYSLYPIHEAVKTMIYPISQKHPAVACQGESAMREHVDKFPKSQA